MLYDIEVGYIVVHIHSDLYYPRFLRPKFSTPKYRGQQRSDCISNFNIHIYIMDTMICTTILYDIYRSISYQIYMIMEFRCFSYIYFVLKLKYVEVWKLLPKSSVSPALIYDILIIYIGIMVLLYLRTFRIGIYIIIPRCVCVCVCARFN